MPVQLLDDVMKINFKPLVACLILTGSLPTVSAYADAMQDIQGKKDDVERTLQEIEKYAALNGGNTVPDPALEGEIGRVETHLNQMDFRLGSLPPCQKTPVPPGTNAAVDALKRLFIDEAEARRQKTKVEDRIKEIRKRIDFLATVNDAAKTLVRAKAAAWAASLALKVIPGLGSLALSPIPGLGTAFDVMGILESAFNNPNAPKNVRGLREYHQYLGENKDRFQSFVSAKAKETLARDPRYSFTERDIIWWAHKFVLENTPTDKQAKERESEDAQKELERRDKQIEELRKNNSYFAGLLARLQAAIDNSEWIRDPSQFEKMKAEIKVTITDDRTGTAISSANLTVAPNAGTARTGGNPYEFEEVSLGGYSLTADAPGYVPEHSQVNVTTCRTYAVNIALKKKPVIKVADVKDQEGHLIDGVKIDVAAITGSGGGSDTYRRVPLSFIVDPGAFTITGTDTGDMYNPASANINAEAGAEVEVHLVMAKKGADLVVEVWDNISNLKIDPPPGAEEPSVELEPLENQAAPSREPYKGNGDVPFSHVTAGRYKYTAHFCGWEVQTGEFALSMEDIKNKRVIRQLYLKPTKLDSFMGNVFEHGESEHIDGFQVALTGLGPRKGYRYDTVEGKDPDPNVVGLHWGAFVIKGPIYSGHYKLEISRKCFQPLVIDDWWVFCGIEPNSAGTFSPQNFQLHPTPEFDHARQQVRGSSNAMTKERKKAATAADHIADARRQMQDLPELAQGVIKELDALKQRNPSLSKDCAEAGKLVAKINDAGTQVNDAAKEITNLRDTAKNLAGVACELSRQAQAATDATKASNHEQNSKKFAEQTRKTAEKAKKVAEDARKTYEAAVQDLTSIKQFEQNVSDLKKAFAPTSTKLQNLRKRLETAAQATESLTRAEAAVTESARLLGSIRQLLDGCADNHPGRQLLDNAVQINNGVVGERERAADELTRLKNFLTGSESTARQADRLGQEIEKMLQSCTDLEVDGSTALDEAKATVETIELFAEVAQESVKAAEECAAKAGITLVAVPAIDNVESAGAILSQAGFTPSFVAKPNTEKSLDFKLATPHTSPGPGEMAKRGSVVTVFVYQKAADSAEPKVTTPQATWVRSEPVIASNGQNGRVPKRMQVSANSLSYGTKSDGKDFANTLKWSSPPAEIKVNDTISLTINSSSQEGPANVGGWWNINCAEKGSLKGDTSAGSTKNYRATGSPDSHNAACTFKFVPQGGDASIQFSGGHDPAPDTWVTVTWTYKRKDAVKDKGAD